MKNLGFRQDGYRRLITLTDIKRGDVVLEDEAIATTTKYKCNWCLEDSRSKCTRCGQGYCSKECQKRDWKIHKLVCGLSSELEMLLKTIEWRQKKNVSTEMFDTLVSLESECSRKELAHFESIATSCDTCYNTPKSELIRILSLFRRNNFELYDQDFFPFAEGVFPFGSLLNHSCRPNCIVLFKKRKMYIIAIQDIHKDEELLISYVDPILPVEERQRALKERYFFDCTCPRCMQSSEIVTRLQVEWTRMVFESFLANYTNPLFFEQKTLAFHLNDFPNYTRSLKEAMESQQWSLAANLCKFVVAVYMVTYPPFHPIIGTQVFTLSKLIWNAQDDPTEYLKLAKVLLEKTFFVYPFVLRELNDFQSIVSIEYPNKV